MGNNREKEVGGFSVGRFNKGGRKPKEVTIIDLSRQNPNIPPPDNARLETLLEEIQKVKGGNSQHVGRTRRGGYK